MLDNAEVEAAVDLDRILGDTALFMLNEARPKLRVSMPTLYRAMRAGRIPYVWVGSRRAITRPVMKRLLREGIGRILDKTECVGRTGLRRAAGRSNRTGRMRSSSSSVNSGRTAPPVSFLYLQYTMLHPDFIAAMKIN